MVVLMDIVHSHASKNTLVSGLGCCGAYVLGDGDAVVTRCRRLSSAASLLARWLPLPSLMY